MSLPKLQSNRRLWVLILPVFATALLAFSLFINEARLVHADSINTTDFVTTWRVDDNDTTVTIPTIGTGYNYNVDWDNDGNPEAIGVTGDLTHDFGDAGDYTIRVSGDFPRIYSDWNDWQNLRKLIDVVQWGDGKWSSMEDAFAGRYKMKVTAQDSPDLSAVTSVARMFSDAESLNSDFSDWDVSNISDMSNMFSGASSFNQPLDEWDVSKVTDMTSMFFGARAFDRPLNSWNTSRVASMQNMFSSARLFNGNISGWNTSSVSDMSGMFYGAGEFNQNIGSWNTSQVIDMHDMFACYSTPAFAASSNCSELNKFNQNIGAWNMRSVESAYGMLGGSSLSVANYDALLLGWASQSLKAGVELGASGLMYDQSRAARQSIIDVHGWQIYGDAGPFTIEHYVAYDKSYIKISGEGLLESDYSEYQMTQLASGRSLVAMDGVELPFCAAGTGNEAAYYIEDGVDPELVSDSPNCYFIAGSGSEPGVSFTPNEVTIWLNDSIHATGVSSISVNGSPEFSFIYEELDKFTPKILEAEFLHKGTNRLLSVEGVFLTPVAGNWSLDKGDEGGVFSIIQKGLKSSLVTINEVALPFCAAGTSLTAQEIIENVGVDESLVSDMPACYYLLNETGGHLLTHQKAMIWLPDNFDTTAKTSISVNGSPVFTINDSIVEPTVSVNGNKSLNNRPTIPTRPTFTGKSEPNAAIKVEVRSDPVICETTADASGNWSCTLPQDLAPGEHTVRVTVTLPNGDTQELGPYTVYVAGEGNLPVVDSNSTTSSGGDVPGVPSTGMNMIKEVAVKTLPTVAPVVMMAVTIVGALLVYRLKTSKS